MSDIDESNVNGSENPKPVKLPYFHRELSPEDKALIGDITPKPVSTPSDEASSKKEGSSVKITEGSAWNAANTWEERDTTTWAKNKLSEVFNAPASAGNKVKISKIEKIEGNSSVTHVRGRARFLYEWSFTLECEITGLLGSFKATANVADVINDQLNDLEIEMKWKNPRPTLLDGRTLQNTLKEEIINRVHRFEEEYKNISK